MFGGEESADGEGATRRCGEDDGVLPGGDFRHELVVEGVDRDVVRSSATHGRVVVHEASRVAQLTEEDIETIGSTVGSGE